MTTEQNQPEASSPEGQPPQGQSQGQGQGHRRRRRRRKGGKTAGAAPVNGQGPQPSPQPSQQNAGQQGVHQQGGGQGQKAKPSSQNRFFQKGGGGDQQNRGNNNGGGGSGRRKGKQRKQQVFVGPMDHSYRVANGNIADSPPSTIELRNGNINGNGHSYSYANESYPSHEPAAVIRDDAPTRIYCFIEDLFVLAKIQETAKKLGVKVGFVKADKDIVAKLSEGAEQDRPSLILFDLNNANAKPLTLIPKIRTKLKKGKTSIIGFLSHLQGDLKVKAVEAGCDVVMPRSSFSQNLPNLLRRHGLDEEEEFETMQVQ